MVRPLVMGAAEGAMRPTINALRSGYGLAPVSTADDFFGRAPMIVTTSSPFEYPHPDWAGRVTLVGAMSWEPPAVAPSELEELKQLEEIDGPLALVTTSSEYQADQALVRTSLDALTDEPFTVIATMPAGVSDLGPVPANARVLRYLPHGPVLARSVVAITHGGMGATQKALSQGVPVCVVPFGRDQLEVAARVVHAGAGTSLPSRKLSVGALRDKVRTASTMTAGARLVAEGFAAAGGAPAAADVVEGMA